MPVLNPKTRVALIFDDGFVKSTLATAALFEEFGLRAAFAVLANPAGFAPRFTVGDFGLWNELKSRGHIIHPHGFTHANLESMSYPDATDEMKRALAVFNEKLHGFDAAQAVWCFAYNRATPALSAWLLARLGAARVGGSGMLTKSEVESRIWHSTTFGPEDPGTDLMDHLTRARNERPAALVYCLHGLDGEAWGAIAKDRLRRALEVITTDDTLEYWQIKGPSQVEKAVI